MGIYRKQIQIVGDILYAAEELTIDHNGASITNLIQKLLIIFMLSKYQLINTNKTYLFLKIKIIK